MFRLFQFLYAFRTTIAFLILEIVCIILIASNNSYNGARLASTSNYFIGSILNSVADVKEYLHLRETNSILANENARLKSRLQQFDKQPVDTSQLHYALRFTEARVINNSTRNEKNFFTLDKGEYSGVHPGMGVISPLGVVGKVKYSSSHFSVGVSLLNIDNQVSGKLNRTGNVGTVQWDGVDAALVKLKYIPRHVSPMVGDTVVTSQYNAVFPSGLIIGFIKQVNLKPESSFYDLDVALANDFTRLLYVDIVINPLKKEKDSIEHITQPK